MTNMTPTSNKTQQSMLSKLLRIAFIFLVIGIDVIISMTKMQRVDTIARTTTKVIDAVRASFPDFCTDGHIMASLDANAEVEAANASKPTGRVWDIGCDSWINDSGRPNGLVTIVDLDQCTTIRPLLETTGKHHDEFIQLNEHNGQKMAVCP